MSSTGYAEGVVFHSPGSRSAPWVCIRLTPNTPKVLYKKQNATLSQRTRYRFGCCITPLAYAARAYLFPGCATRPWADEFNAFSVKGPSQTDVGSESLARSPSVGSTREGVAARTKEHCVAASNLMTNTIPFSAVQPSEDSSAAKRKYRA